MKQREIYRLASKIQNVIICGCYCYLCRIKRTYQQACWVKNKLTITVTLPSTNNQLLKKVKRKKKKVKRTLVITKIIPRINIKRMF